MISLPPDSSFLFQIIAFLVFWALMKRLLFDPVQSLLEEREQRGRGVRALAEAVSQEAAGLEKRTDAALRAAREEALREAEEIRRLAQAEERAIIERARVQAAELVAKTREEVRREAASALSLVERRARELAASVAAAVIGRPV